MEDDLDQSDEVNDLVGVGGTVVEMGSQSPFPSSESGPSPDWCICGLCAPMPQIVENKCCKQKNCVTLSWVTLEMTLKITVSVLLGKLHTGNMYWHDMGTWEKEIDGFVHVKNKKTISICYRCVHGI